MRRKPKQILQIMSFKITPELCERLRREAARRNLLKRCSQRMVLEEILDANLPPLDAEDTMG